MTCTSTSEKLNESTTQAIANKKAIEDLTGVILIALFGTIFIVFSILVGIKMIRMYKLKRKGNFNDGFRRK
jgi:hypothetical protein